MQCVLHLTSSKERNVSHLNQNIMNELLIIIGAVLGTYVMFGIINPKSEFNKR